MIEFDGEAEWTTHELAGHSHREQVILWDEELKMGWPAELRCSDCEAVRYLQRNEAVSKIAAQNLRRAKLVHEDPHYRTQVTGMVYGEPQR